MFDIWSFKGIDAVVSSGLGGGSLIYANVLLRKDEHWFVEKDRVGPDGSYWTWPVSRENLDPFYMRAESMLNAQQFPFAHPDYAQTPKTVAMQQAAQELGLEWILPPLAVTFADGDDEPRRGAPITTPGYGNIHGLPRVTCRMCGECDVGCNYGAKNTLDHNYLSAAADRGAEIRTRCDARRIEPRADGGWNVWYIEHLPAHEGHRTPSSTQPRELIVCDRLVIGAGTLGSTFLLLANRSALPGISPTLGTRFSGNGDLLGFMTKARHRDGTRKVVDGSNGPVITSAIRLDDAADRRVGDPSYDGPERGAYIEDAGYPEFANWLVEAAMSPGQIGRLARFSVQRLWSQLKGGDANLSGEISTLLGGIDTSETSMPLLGMGRDTPDGVMSLRGGRLDVNWQMAMSSAYFERVTDTMRDIAKVHGAGFTENFLSNLSRVVTVHPLGGVPMGHDEMEGTVDAYGRVFGFDHLYVADGSVMPGPIGANPALTIAAFAERAAEAILEETP
jgi:cholesterol oxidase